MIVKDFAIFITLLSSMVKSLDLNVRLVSDFLNEMYLSCGIVLHCENSIDVKKWSSLYQNEFKFLSFYDISQKEFNGSKLEEFMKLNYKHLGVIVDATCQDETIEIFAISSEFKYFNASYFWLMISNNYNSSVQLLRQQNINLDAEITLAIVDDNNNFALFDIYNPSFKYNAQLVITEKGTYNDADGMRITLKGSKLSMRKNLQGIVLNAGIVAVGVKPNQTFEEYLESYENPTVDTQHRHQYQLHKILAQKYNYR